MSVIFYLLAAICWLLEDFEIVCGMSCGADSLGKRHAEERGYAVKEMAAN